MDVFGYKIDIFDFSRANALISSMVVFTPKFLVSVSFQHYFNWIAKVQTPNWSEFSQKFIVKTVKLTFLNFMLCYYFSLEAVLQGIAENNPTKKQIDGEV